MTILVIGEYYSENLGDPLLCEVVTKIIEEKYPDAKIIPFDISGKTSMVDYYNVDQNCFSERFKRSLRRKLKKIPFVKLRKKPLPPHSRIINHLKEILKNNHIDLAVFAGGEMFMDYFAPKIHIVVKMLGETKIIFHACGMDKFTNKTQSLLKKVFKRKNVLSISLRDSYESFVAMFGKDKVIKTYDTALLCSQYFQPAENKKFEYGVGCIENEGLFDFQVNLIRFFNSRNLNWQLFTNGTEYDYNFGIRLLKAAGISEENLHYRLHERPVCAKELVKEVTEYEKIVSFRMHSQIAAVSFGIPSFGFVWDSKVKELYNKLGYVNNYSAPQGEISEILDLDLLNIDSELLARKAVEQGKSSKSCLLSCIQKALETN